MEKVKVAVRYSNREAERIYNVCGENWQEIKDAVKATGAKFDSINKRWIVPGQAFKDQIKSRFQIENADFLADGMTGWISSAANGEPIFHCETADVRNGRMSEIAAQLQAAYNESDAKFAEVFQATK